MQRQHLSYNIPFLLSALARQCKQIAKKESPASREFRSAGRATHRQAFPTSFRLENWGVAPATRLPTWCVPVRTLNDR